MKRWLLIVPAVVALASCGRPDNPLLSASDRQFARLMEPKNAFSPSCAAALYEPELYVKQYNGLKFSPAAKISMVSGEQVTECVAELRERAAAQRIRGEVTRDDLLDERVRQRYFATRNR